MNLLTLFEKLGDWIFDPDTGTTVMTVEDAKGPLIIRHVPNRRVKEYLRNGWKVYR